jgi:hypothetical protein
MGLCFQYYLLSTFAVSGATKKCTLKVFVIIPSKTCTDYYMRVPSQWALESRCIPEVTRFHNAPYCAYTLKHFFVSHLPQYASLTLSPVSHSN